MLITDMIECGRTFTQATIDWVHGNAIEPDFDGNLLISSRHLNEITKIDRSTGNIIWRFGLNAKNNDFTFSNDTHGFAHQHDIRRLPNGHITLFDNGNCLSPQSSHALEYELDENNMIATLVWSYENTPSTYSFAMGNVQRHQDGGTLIGWGAASVNPNITELHDDDSIALQIGFSEPTTWSYRAFRFPWRTSLFATAEDSLDFGSVNPPAFQDLPLTILNPAADDLDISCFVSSDASFFVTDAVPVTVPAGGSTVVNVRFNPSKNGVIKGDLYVRAVNDTQLVARVVALRGTSLWLMPALPPVGLLLLGGVLLAGAVWAVDRRRRAWGAGRSA